MNKTQQYLSELARIQSEASKFVWASYRQEQKLIAEFALTPEGSCPDDPTRQHDYEPWSKCPFCGARNGKFGRPLEQHKPRCLFTGDANTRSVVKVGHDQMIREDDLTFLPMMHALDEIGPARHRISALEKENLHLQQVILDKESQFQWAILDKESQLQEMIQDTELQRTNKTLHDAIVARKKSEVPKKTKK